MTPNPIPRHFFCSVTLDVMRDPVLVGEHNFERSSIQEVIEDARRKHAVPLCPLTRQQIRDDPRANPPLQREIRQWLSDNPQWNVDTFLRAAARDKVADVDEQLFFGIIPSAKDGKGRNVLHVAAENNSVNVLNFLFQRCDSAAISAMLSAVQPKQQYTPLHIAAKSFYSQVYMLLVSKGAAETAVDFQGNTPIQLAINTDPKQALPFVMSVLHLSEPDAYEWINHYIDSMEDTLHLQPDLELPAASDQTTDFSLSAFLKKAKLSHLKVRLVEEELVTLETLQSLTNDDLKELGLTLGARKRFLSVIQSYRLDTGPPLSKRIESMRKLRNDLFGSDFSQWPSTWKVNLEPYDVASLREATRSSQGSLGSEMLLTILDAINRSMPLGDLVTDMKQYLPKLKHVNSKNLLTALFYRVPHEKLYGVVQRLSQSETAIPFITPSLREIDEESVSDLKLHLDCFLKNHILCLLNDSRIIASVRSSSVRGHSSFLNHMFATSFDTNSTNAFHSGSVDIIYDNHDLRGAHIVDLHGSLQENSVQASFLSQICSVLLIHISPAELPLLDDVSSRIRKLIDHSRYKVLVIVRDALEIRALPTDSSAGYDMIQTAKISENPEELRSQKMIISKVMHSHLNRVGTQKSFSNLELVAKLFSPFMRTEFIADGLNQMMHSISTSLDLCFNHSLAQKLFPFTRHMTPVLELVSKGEPMEEASSRLNKLQETDIHSIVTSYLGTMLRFPDSVLLITFLVSNLISISKKPHVDPLLSAREKRLEEIRDSNVDTKRDKELVRIAKQLNTHDIGIEHLWRELISIHTASQERFHSCLVSDEWCNQLEQVCVSVLSKGVPMEIVNGDSSTLHTNFLTNVFRRLESISSKPLFTFSIVGPQSSGKSTLLNYVLGCLFPVRAGRCSKGLFATWIQTTDPKEPNLLVLDSEGLFSIERGGDSLFDNQMMLMCLASSHLLFINVKNNFNETEKGVLTIAASALKQLVLDHQTPIYRIILRDVTDMAFDPTEVKEKIMQDFKEISRVQGSSIEEIIRTDLSSQFVKMRQAFNSADVFLNGTVESMNVASPAFSRDCGNLKQIIHSDMVDSETENRLISPQAWFQNVKANWGSLKQFGELYNFKDYRAYIQQKELDAIFLAVYSSFSQSLNAKGDSLIVEASKKLFTSGNSVNRLDSTTMKSLREMFENALDESTEQLKTQCSSFPQDSVEQKCENIKNILEKDHQKLIQQWNEHKTDNKLRNNLNAFKQQLKKWVEDHVSVAEKTTEQLMEEFDVKRQSIRAECEQQQRNVLCSEEDIREKFANFFKSYISHRNGKRLTSAVLRDYPTNWKTMWESLSQKLCQICGFSSKPNAQSMRQAEQHLRNCMQAVDPIAQATANKYDCVQFSAVQYAMSELYSHLETLQHNFKIKPKFEENVVRRLRMQLVKIYSAKQTERFQKHMHDFDFTAGAYRDWFEMHAKDIHSAPEKVKIVASLFMNSASSSTKDSLHAEFKQILKRKLLTENKIDTPESFDVQCFHFMNGSGETKEDMNLYYRDILKYQRQYFSHLKTLVVPPLCEQFEAKWAAEMRSRCKELLQRVDAMKELFGVVFFEPNPDMNTTTQRMAKIKKCKRELFKLITSGLSGSLPSSLKGFFGLYYKCIGLSSGECPQPSSSCLTSGTSYGSLLPNLINDEVPNVKAFMDGLSKMLKELLDAELSEPPSFASLAESHCKEWFETCRGCIHKCPYCGAKCTYHAEHSGKHSTQFHKFSAFGGTRWRESRRATLQICNCDKFVNGGVLGYGDESDVVFSPLSKHLSKYHPNWEILKSSERKYESIMKGHWKKIGEGVCEAFHMVYHEEFE